ncbi:MAG: glycosyltransferase family 4 protein [Planctomycetota bacterium]|nr:glycosyltransferase family 4 protein [Planctomycetota bacterium]
MTRVLVVGCWDESAGLPRTESLVQALVDLEHEVEECFVNAPLTAGDPASRRRTGWAMRLGAMRRARARVRAAVKAALSRGPLDMVLVPYPGALTVSWVRSVFEGPVVLDLFRATEGEWMDRIGGGAAGVSAPRALVRIDRAACRAADLVLVDTAAQADHLARITGVSRTRFGVVPICDPDGPIASPVPEHDPAASLRLLLFGKGLPSHGLATWIEAVRRSPSTRLEMIGGDDVTRRLVKAALGSRVEVVAGFLPMNQLRERIEAAQVVGGVVDPSPSVARTVPYRIVHALAHGRPVLTARTEALRDVLTPGVDCIAMPMADAGQTALVLERLAREPNQLDAIGRAARATYEARFSPSIVRDRFDALLGNRLGFRAPQRLPMRTEARVLVPTS